ncbi:MAG: hypothetical protein R3E90_13960 [Marinicella sp.]
MVKFIFASKFLAVGMMMLTALVHAEEFKPFQPFEISSTKSFTTSPNSFSQSNPFTQNALVLGQSNFDLWATRDKGYHLTTNSDGVFGEELVMGMKFADWLSLRVNVIDEERAGYSLFAYTPQRLGHSEDDLFGYQFGVSSVLNISNNWRFGIDLGVGRVGGEMLGLYQDKVETTSLGFGIRNNKFGATFQSDFMNGMSNTGLEQSTMDLQVDWHFTRDGTISFGARRNITENTPTGNSLSELTGTVPYIKFKHNL